MRNNKSILSHNDKQIKNKEKKKWFVLLSTRTQLTNEPKHQMLATGAGASLHQRALVHELGPAWCNLITGVKYIL